MADIDLAPKTPRPQQANDAVMVRSGASAPFGGDLIPVEDLQNPYNVEFTDVGGQATAGDTFVWLGQQVDGLFADFSGKQSTSQKGQPNGYAPLDAGGKVAASFLPGFVDDVLEFADLAGFPATGETGKMYVALDTGKVYRWSGSAYVEISASPGSTDAVPEGVTNLYHTGARVRTTPLTGFAEAGAAAAIIATDTVLAAFGKVQKWITDFTAALAGKQDSLVSGTNIKTINGASVLGGGNLVVSGAGLTFLTSTSTGTQNDWSPGALGSDTLVNWSGASSLLATGIAGGSAGYRLTFRNSATNRIMVFALSNAGSVAANRVGANSRDPVIILPGESASFIHDGSGWLQASQPHGGPRDNWNYMAITPGNAGSYGVLGTTAFNNGGTANTQGVSGIPSSYRVSGPRATWSTGTTAGTSAGIRTNPTTFHRGSGAGLGGGLGIFVWSFETLPASAETWFVGFGSGAVAPANQDASARVDQVGWGRDPADSAQVRLMHNDNTGISTKIDLGATFPENTTSVFGGLIFMSPQADGFATVLWRRDDVTVTPSVNDVTTDLITADLRLQPILWINNRAAAAAYEMSSHQPMRLWGP